MNTMIRKNGLYVPAVIPALALLAGFILVGCVSLSSPGKSGRPDWVNGNSSKYPTSQYIIGVGPADNRETAEDKARAEIAKVFTASIEQRSRDFEEYLQVASGGKETTTERLDIKRVTLVSTEKILSGITIADHYLDQNASPPTVYALAVLNRAQARNSLVEKISQADREVKGLAASAESSPDLLSKVKLLKQAIGAQVLREAYNEELRVVDTTGQGIAAPVGLSDLKIKLAGLLKNELNISIEVTGPYKAETARALAEGLTKQGFVINPDASRATVMLSGVVEITRSDVPSDTWKFVRWSVDFQMVDRRDGKIFGAVKANGKEGQLTAAAAEERAVRVMQNSLATEVGQKLTAYIFGQ